MSLVNRRISLTTGVTLDVTVGGADHAPPILFLHGFPESARTWRHQLADLARDHHVAAPDQRGFARSDKPPRVEDYATNLIVADAIALADALGFGRFTLVGHDWGGAVAWAIALAHPDRVARLVICNAPHPHVFQASLIDHPAQRAASQYMRAFREPGMGAKILGMGLETFFDRFFAPYAAAGALTPKDRVAYLDEWSQPGAIEAMLNWYKASRIVVPATGEDAPRPAWLDQPFPKLTMPVLVTWGMGDHALLPVQLDSLADHVPDLRIVRIDAGHFAPWEAPEPVTAAIRAFLADRGYDR